MIAIRSLFLLFIFAASVQSVILRKDRHETDLNNDKQKLSDNSIINNYNAAIAEESKAVLVPSRPRHHHRATPSAAKFNGSPALSKFVDPLPIIPSMRLGSGGIVYVNISQFETKMHRDLPPTTVWGYNGRSPGPIFNVLVNQTIKVVWANNLPSSPLLNAASMWHPDYPVPEVRTVTHLHGQHADEISDGIPDNWFGPGEQSEVYTYNNQQSPALLWYHDHALGVTRSNAYAGLNGLYVIRDPAIEKPLNLPQGTHEIFLTLNDRSFTKEGQLFYPGPEWSPEFYGDTIVVNGMVWPYLKVQPHKYRFRMVNSANARYFNLFLDNKDSFTFIGGDGGYLPHPVTQDMILLAPGERADIIVDFSRYSVGTNITLRNDAPAPYPSGDDPDDRTSYVLLFNVITSKQNDKSKIPQHLPYRHYDNTSAAINQRSLSLIEREDEGGEPSMVLLNNLTYSDPVTEDPIAGSVEKWDIINLTDDNHPIHIHNSEFRILWRRPFNVSLYEETNTKNKISYLGMEIEPEPYEAGWKDTARADPGMVTTLLVRFAPLNGTFVWHCHILEHEDNEMMRPLLLRPVQKQIHPTTVDQPIVLVR